MTNENDHNALRRSINWKQGFFIAIGIPMAILPTLGYTVSYLWAASILLWSMSVIQGFLQNMAFGELATTFPNASGIPGFCQEIFMNKKGQNKKYDRGRLVGGFCGWAYWFVWAPGHAIFIILIGYYMVGLFPSLAEMDPLILNLIIGMIVLGGLAFVASRGLRHSSRPGRP
jgi:amino acid transporter